MIVFLISFIVLHFLNRKTFVARFHNYELTGLIISKWDPDVSDYPPPVTLTQLRAAPCTKYDSQWRLGTGQEGGEREMTLHVITSVSQMIVPGLEMMKITNIFNNVEIKRELRFCAGFNCKTIHFTPQVCQFVPL